jgi:hypothetical protein
MARSRPLDIESGSKFQISDLVNSDFGFVAFDRGLEFLARGHEIRELPVPRGQLVKIINAAPRMIAPNTS